MIDFDPKKVINQPNNLLIVPEFKGDGSDRELYNLLPFLESNYLNRHRIGITFNS